jgi:signal transduction histidine kinase
MHLALRHKFLLAFESALVAIGALTWLLCPWALVPIVVVTGAAMLVGWILLAVGSWRLHQSLSRVRRAAEAIGRGDLSRRVELQPLDDIEKLIRSFNQMADRLEQTVSEERDLQQQLSRTEKLAAIGELAATVAHEVNNPLDGLQNCSRIIRRSAEDPQKVRHLLDLMDGALYRIEMIVRRLLMLARDEPPRLAVTPLNEVITEAIAFVEPRIARQGVELVREVPERPLYVECDRQQLVQVMINLMVNALDSMPDGGRLTIGLGPAKGGQLNLSVRDTGSGIAREHLGRIFEPFFTRKAGGAGTGLGLAVVKKIIDAHRGRIRVDSRPGEGTSFTIELSAATFSQAQVRLAQPAEVR